MGGLFLVGVGTKMTSSLPNSSLFKQDQIKPSLELKR